MKILVIHGPNLNLLGTRQVDHYGHTTLQDIDHALKHTSAKHDISIRCLQSNHEGEIIDTLHNSAKQYDYLIINPAAFTHTSIAILDAILAIELPFVEVHISNIANREPFRKHSFFSSSAMGTISGFGAHGYQLALQAIIHQHNQRNTV